MNITFTITLDMLLTEQKRIRAHMERTYPTMVKERRITTYERDHRLSCNKKIIDLLTEAKQNKKNNGPKLMELLNKM